MSDIKSYIGELGLAVARKEAKEYLCGCPWCASSDSLSVNGESGLWRCFHGCGSGNLWTLAARLRPSAEKKEIVGLLKSHGLWDENAKRDSQNRPKPKTWPRIKDTDHRPMLEEEIAAYCTRKNIDPASFAALEPRMLVASPHHVLIPAYDPTDMSRPRAYLRDTLDGSPILIDGEPQKYPLVPKENPDGTNKALVGLNATRRFRDLSGVVYAEGWKDMLAAMSYGLPAVANSHGAGSWDDDWLGFFRDKTVWVVFDADDTGVRCGRRHAERVAVVARECRLVRLPYEVVPKHGKDLHDYIREDRHTTEEFYTLLDGGELIKRPAASEQKAAPAAEEPESVLLVDNYPDTIAREFEAASPYKHKYHPTEGWSMYKNGKYQAIDPDKQLSRYVSGFMGRCTYMQGKRPARIKLSRQAINDVIHQVSFLNSVYLLPSHASPCWLKDGMPDKIIPLDNGLLDWSQWPFKLLDHTPDYYTRNYLPFGWEGDIKSDLWDGYLADVTGNDEEVMHLLQQWAGYCLLPNNDQQKFLLIHGPSGTGKSVFSDVLVHLIGMENISTVSLRLFAEPHMVTQTYGKMLNVCDESEDALLDPAIENALKQYTGGTPYQFKSLYQAPFSAYPTAKLMISTNHLPKFKDTSEGIWRRLIVVPFNYVVPDPVAGLSEIIARSEMPGVLAWALRGAKSILETGKFIEPEACRQSLAEYKNEMFPERVFLLDNFEETENVDLFVTCKAVKRAYEKWAKDANYGVKNDRNFGNSVRSVFPKVDRLRVMKGGQRIYYYYGLTMKTDSEYYEADIYTA
jgi:P4 family phage/plasmid primase-like protien